MRRPSLVRAFTLTELLVAVAVLIVIILATARIFGTVSKVTGAGEANADILQTAAAIEKQVRADLERISRDGFLVIQSVEVPNNVNGNGVPLLNSALPPTATVRCDQLVFFTAAPQVSTAFTSTDSSGNPYINAKQSTISRVYWGHAVQLRNAAKEADPFTVPNFGWQTENGAALVPWLGLTSSGPDRIATVNWATGQTIGEVTATQPGAREWILARQAMLIADDGGSAVFYHVPPPPGEPPQPPRPELKNSTRDIWAVPSNVVTGANRDPGVLSSRIDFSFQLANSIRRTVLGFPADASAPLNDQATRRNQMLRAVGAGGNGFTARWPRAEKVAPSMARADQMLTNPVIAGQCSSFAVEWTWEDRTGRQVDAQGNALVVNNQPMVGLVVRGDTSAPWFGMPNAERGTQTLSQVISSDPEIRRQGSLPCVGANWLEQWGCVGLPIDPRAIEGNEGTEDPQGNFYPAVQSFTGGILSGVRLYRATFGYNTTQALNAAGAPDLELGYTPWPTALRFTFTLHDPEQRFTDGRTFQFVVELPRR
jgi:type II secretory pathway pseudopilin PulG